jgi:septation ring formation regulator EzrA
LREGFDHLSERLDRHDQRLSVVEGSLAKVIDAVTEIAKVQEKHSALLIGLVESERIKGGGLNAVEARLARIEKQTGLTLA